MLRSSLPGILLAFAGALAHAQDVVPETTAAPAAPAPEAPLTVHVSASAVDPVGRQFVEAIAEQLRQSTDLVPVDVANGARVRLKIATLDPDDNIGRRTVYSVVVTVRPVDRELDVYWNNYVGLCGQARVQACARSIVDEAGAPAASLRTIIETTLGPAP
ncbi:hypothetical protein HIV01_017095 [Lysobacter arenosi]|uniref:Uncharacterized protein n=1 Tax=Lysobacter arenosi TaxID=2795387 RepID=A0ABX7R9M8_9GAMM|nr:hypothetical protein [Lysobacter arenosi]QSX74838.1 hypothetical protein HIV01_017095 [Lysobacter arenosi]